MGLDVVPRVVVSSLTDSFDGALPFQGDFRFSLLVRPNVCPFFIICNISLVLGLLPYIRILVQFFVECFQLRLRLRLIIHLEL